MYVTISFGLFLLHFFPRAHILHLIALSGQLQIAHSKQPMNTTDTNEGFLLSIAPILKPLHPGASSIKIPTDHPYDANNLFWHNLKTRTTIKKMRYLQKLQQKRDNCIEQN